MHFPVKTMRVAWHRHCCVAQATPRAKQVNSTMGTKENERKVNVCCRIRPLSATTSTSAETNATDLLEDSGSHIQSAGPSLALLARGDSRSSNSSNNSSSSTAGRASNGESKTKGVRRKRDRWEFTFDDVLEDGCSQHEVYQKCAQDIVESVLAGINGTTMACEIEYACDHSLCAFRDYRNGDYPTVSCT